MIECFVLRHWSMVHCILYIVSWVIRVWKAELKWQYECESSKRKSSRCDAEKNEQKLQPYTSNNNIIELVVMGEKVCQPRTVNPIEIQSVKDSMIWLPELYLSLVSFSESEGDIRNLKQKTFKHDRILGYNIRWWILKRRQLSKGSCRWLYRV